MRNGRPTTANGIVGPVATVRLFASARQAAGTSRDVIEAPTVEALLREAVARYGPEFGAVLATCRVWVNGEEAEAATPLCPADEVAILPPVSGG
jgi:sulfur-carrier protein